MKIIKAENIARYEVFIIVGFIMALATLTKLIGIINFSSDWLWFLAGAGLMLEGFISLVKQRRFDSKYKVLERSEYERIIKS